LFCRKVGKYTRREVGSLFLPGDMIAVFLWAQVEDASNVTQARMSIWRQYHEMPTPLEGNGALRRPIVPLDCQHNAHMLLPANVPRELVLDAPKCEGSIR
jgi:dTDP-4-amino-4,6-dideoxygalactose transaminase